MVNGEKLGNVSCHNSSAVNAMSCLGFVKSPPSGKLYWFRQYWMIVEEPACRNVVCLLRRCSGRECLALMADTLHTYHLLKSKHGQRADTIRQAGLPKQHSQYERHACENVITS